MTRTTRILGWLVPMAAVLAFVGVFTPVVLVALLAALVAGPVLFGHVVVLAVRQDRAERSRA